MLIIAPRAAARFALVVSLWGAASACSRGSTGSGANNDLPPPPSADAIPALIQLANNTNADIDARVAAVRDLGRIPDSASLIEPTLRSLWTHTDHDLATAAAAGLRRLAGQSELSFARTVVLGASVSAGFMGSPVATELERGLSGKPQVLNQASTFFFKAPRENGEKQVAAALAFEPTVVFALDFLFWYVYVSGTDLDYRRTRMTAGLRLLETFQVPVIVGDIPDMRTAATWMLPASVVPPPEHLQTLNRELRAWSRTRLNVHLVPLAAWAQPLLAGGNVIDNGETVAAADLVGPDGLHANARGVRYMLRQVDGQLEKAFADTSATALRIVE